MQQFEELNQNYEKLEDEYRLYKQQQLRRKESFDSAAAVTLLEDKLRGKQRELDRQVSRNKLIEFIQNHNIELQYTFSETTN
jgi:hypothetical protein